MCYFIYYTVSHLEIFIIIMESVYVAELALTAINVGNILYKKNWSFISYSVYANVFQFPIICLYIDN